jgi:response regulator RpfG family c-di-GMP phosphodiesterase
MVSSLDLAGRSILVVEDEALVRLDLTERLQDARATVFAASRLDKALVLAAHPCISAGVLDFDLGNADSTSICWKLVDRRIPFIFYTGRVYSAFRQWPSAPRNPETGHARPDLHRGQAIPIASALHGLALHPR